MELGQTQAKNNEWFHAYRSNEQAIASFKCLALTIYTEEISTGEKI